MSYQYDLLCAKLAKALAASEELRAAIIEAKGEARYYAVTEVEIAIHRLRDSGKEIDRFTALEINRKQFPALENVDEPIPYTLTETAADAAGGA